MGRYGMAGDHYRQSGYVTLQDVPDPNREYVETFQNLTGGMNRFDLDYRLKGNESPFMQNMSWHNGTLTSRLGQVEKWQLEKESAYPAESLEVISTSQFLFNGWLLIQATDTLYALKIEATDSGDTAYEPGDLYAVWPSGDEWPQSPGVFFRYREDVFFKGKGVYTRIFCTHHGRPIADGQTVDGFVPTIFIDADPATGAGLEYQKENRLSNAKKIIYSVTAANTLEYHLPVTEVSMEGLQAYLGTDVTAQYDLDLTRMNISEDGLTLIDGIVFLQTAPPVDSKLTIFYRKDNDGAYSSLMDSTTMTVFGGAQELCVVMGGPDAQPNAYFWSGNNGIVMDPTYFPMNQYNLAGDNDDPIVAFGKQQNMLVIFQPHATGRAVFGTETLDGLVQVTMNYTRINAEIGCDLPGSLQLVENNLVWCNRRYGVCRLKDSSAAYENNIVQISRKINGDYRLDGLLEQLKSVADDEVHSVDTGKRYILTLGTDAYEWNYELSQYDNPSWFFHTNILGVGFVPLENEVLYEVTADGKVATFEPVFSDFGTTAIEKIYRFPPRDFGSYDRVKNIKSMLFQTRGDYKTNTQIEYRCDYGSRVDATNLAVIPPAGATQGSFAKDFRRKPGYHNIHHLGIELSNNTAGEDLNLISAQIFYEYRGRTR